jgi:16S rRNA (uracil1498-N3)-methyltransferase
LILFYTNLINNIDGSLVEEEFHHCAHVLRKKEGDEINVTDGVGHLYKGRIKNISRNNLIFDIIEKQFFEKPHPSHCIAISPTKSNDRIEWFLEKAVEIGIGQFAFVLFKRTERAHLNLNRLQKIAISAMKQSLQSHVPIIEIIENPEKFINNYENFKYKWLANCEVDSGISILKRPTLTENAIIVIGPEGDFTNNEIVLFENNGYESISLGKTRLRTETAGLVAATLLQNLS